jgi:hypothetical protein
MLGVHVPPQLCSASREVPCGFQDSLWARGALLDYVDPRHGAIVRAAAQTFWDEEPLISQDWATTYRVLAVEDVMRSIFSMGVLLGWRAAAK